MALGDITEVAPDLFAMEILASATAANSAPASATAGAALAALWSRLGAPALQAEVVLASTAGSGTMSVTGRIWLRYGTLAGLSGGLWCPAGIGSDSGKGVLNGGSALGEVATDIIRHAEPLYLPAFADRVFLEVSSFSGSATAVTGFLLARRAYGVS